MKLYKSPKLILLMLIITFTSCGKFTSKLKLGTTSFHPTLLTSGQLFNCALFDNRKVKCWGDNTNGQLGNESTDDLGDDALEINSSMSFINLGTNRTVKQLSSGSFHSCAVLDNGTVKCWGKNSSAQLGSGNTTHLGDNALEMGDNLPIVDLGTGRTALQVKAGASHTCALLDDGSVKCWGENLAGQLGQENTNMIGDSSNEMGDSLPAVNLGTNKTAIEIAVGFNTTCAILNDATTKCWGQNINGEAGIETSVNIGDDPGEMGDSLLDINFGTNRTAIKLTGGATHICALLDNGSVKCWGRNNVGQLGQGSTATLGDSGGEMGDALPAVDLGTGRTAVAISANNENTCALLDNSKVKCWGINDHGQLGQGSVDTLGDGALEMGDALPIIELGTGRTSLQISTGGQHACALLNNFTVKCWGRTSEGQAGIGITANIGDDLNELGDNLAAIDF